MMIIHSLLLLASAVTAVTLNFSDVVDYEALSYFGVRNGSVYDILWRPKYGHTVEKVEDEGFTFHDGSAVTSFRLVLNFAKPILAAVHVADTPSGETGAPHDHSVVHNGHHSDHSGDGKPFKHFWKDGAVWKEATKEEFDGFLKTALETKLQLPGESLTLDLANVDETKFHKNTSANDVWTVHNLTPFNGFSVTKLVDGDTTLWEAENGTFAYYALFFSGPNGKVVRLHVVDDKRFAHKVRHFKDGKWDDTNINTYIETIDSKKSGAHTLDVSPGKHDHHDVSFVKGAAFGVDYDLFTTSMHHNFDKVVFEGETLYDRNGKKEHCSHVAVHNADDKKTVHVLVVDKNGSRSLFFSGESKPVVVDEKDFPKEFRVVAE